RWRRGPPSRSGDPRDRRGSPHFRGWYGHCNGGVTGDAAARERANPPRRLVMSLQNLVITGVLLAATSALVGCPYGDESEREEGGAAKQAVGPNGGNDISPEAIDAEPLKRSVTNSFGITSPNMADPLPLCKAGTISPTGCTMKEEWEMWLAAD